MHNPQSSNTFEASLIDLRESILQKEDLPHISVRELLAYVDALTRFPLGRVLIQKGSIDAFWTDFIMSSCEKGDRSNLEDFVLTRSPFTIAWRELLKIFQKVLQDYLKNGMTIASIPCGAMREILELDYSSISDLKIVGVDIDLRSLSLAQELARKQKLSKYLHLHQQDAWHLSYTSEIDMLTSCGLNIYTPDPNRVLDLYRQFFKALKPGGQLILSFLTYPPGKSKLSEWQTQKILEKDLFLETVLYEDILNAQWRNFRTSDEIEKELRDAGFSEVCFHYDSLHVFPAVVAIKQ
jgi:Methylase involved in ubiquinone/menaquinone biosynthesis